ncbi:hypothetical protein [Actinacidiphila soli]|uniref:hypothetical protein n=1 Tax=Actinacidiphila soli TaxID=2487275 RepID=UPI000FCB7BA9|nr:hypothetical protein [Actinacidiphila soli]
MIDKCWSNSSTSGARSHLRSHPRRDPRPDHRGWGIGIDAPSLLGGDDFAEPFDLCDPTWISDGTLLGMLREAVQHHDTWLLLQLSHDRQQFRLTTQ